MFDLNEKNVEAEQCECYRLINLLVVSQQLVSVYLIANYPLKGSPKRVNLFIQLSTLLFSAIGLIGVFGAHYYNDSVLKIFIVCLLSYGVIQALIGNKWAKIEPTISDFHWILLIVSALLASLTFTTLTTRHTFSEYRHSDQVWTWMS